MVNGLTIASFLPTEFLLFLLAGAGIALIVGARRLAGAMFILTLASAILPPFIEPLLNLLPLWVLLLIGVGLAFTLLRAILAVFIGARGADSAVGTLIANLLIAILLFPRVIIRALTRWLA